MKNQGFQTHPARPRRWSNRILTVSLVGIACLTLFPFHFDFAVHHGPHVFPFLLGTSAPTKGNFDFFLNILLFIPFGFGVCAVYGKPGAGQWSSLPVSLAAGAIISYLVEVLQFYIPTRNSGWNDVLSNTLGSGAGFFLFALCGDAILRQLSNREVEMETWLTPFRTAALLLAYFGLYFWVSIPLQRETRLSNWDAQSALFVGNDASAEHAWKGKVFRLQIWNRSLPEKLVARVIAGNPVPEADSSLLSSYDFTTSPPYLDERQFLPALRPILTPSSPVVEHPFEMNGANWLTTTSPVAELTREIQKTNRFTVHLVCTPAGIRNTDGRIVSISQSAENVNLHLRQEAKYLVLFFRNPLSETHSNLVWYVPDVFQAGQMRDIVASYDGADAAIYIDGKKAAGGYRLGPGAGLMHRFFFVQTAGLEGYVVVYEILIFLPAGLLIGMAARKWRAWNQLGKFILVIGLFLPPVFLELLLVSVSGRRVLPENIYISVMLGIAGAVLINADFPESLPVEPS